MLENIASYWLKQSAYDTTLGVYATFPFLMVPSLLLVNAPYGKNQKRKRTIVDKHKI